MSCVQANWHTGSLGSDEDTDPFEGLPIEQIGTPIALNQPTAELNRELARLMAKEARLDACGVSCPIKDRDDTTCSACPVSRAGEDVELASLCVLGRRQEEVATTLAVKRHRTE